MYFRELLCLIFLLNISVVIPEENVFRNNTRNDTKINSDDPLEHFMGEMQKYVKDCKSRLSDESSERYANNNRRGNGDNKQIDDEDASFSSRQYYISKSQKFRHSANERNQNNNGSYNGHQERTNSYGRRNKNNNRGNQGNNNSNENDNQQNRNSNEETYRSYNRNHNDDNRNNNDDNENSNGYYYNQNGNNRQTSNSRTSTCDNNYSGSNSRHYHSGYNQNNDQSNPTNYDGTSSRTQYQQDNNQQFYGRNPYNSYNDNEHYPGVSNRNDYPYNYQGASDYQRPSNGYPFLQSSSNNQHYVTRLNSDFPLESNYPSYNGQANNNFNSYPNNGFESQYQGYGDVRIRGVNSYNTQESERRNQQMDRNANRDMRNGNGDFVWGLEPPTDSSTKWNNGRHLRISRNSENLDRSDEMVECISQCVFGYLEVLDENKLPSEAAIIKWLQGNENNDSKRIKALRKVRRCYARLAVSDIEEGCEFSRLLTNCLGLDIK